MALHAEKVPRKMALTAPMLLNLTYEFITLARDYRYLLRDPERLDHARTATCLKDIYAGFSGANFGIGRITRPKLFF